MSQRDRVLRLLKTGAILTRLNAWDLLGVLEAPARISELRASGWPIVTEMIVIRNRFGEDVRVAKWHLDKRWKTMEGLTREGEQP